MKARFVSLAGVLITLAASALHADTITLTDGRVIQGHLDRNGSKYVITPNHGVVFEVPVKDLASIELGGPANPATAAKNAFSALQYHIGRQTSLDTIIKSITDYMAHYPHSAFLKKAQAELIKYQQYRSLGFVRFDGKWVSAQQVKALKAQSTAKMEMALTNYKAGKFEAAGALAQAALKINPSNGKALIILGALDYRAGNYTAASRHFSAVLAKNPKNVIANNDLAITAYHQRQQPRALVYYRKALNLDSGNRLLLDNIFIALNHYSGNHAAMLYQNLRHLFTQADVKMQTLMARKGLYRLGATWVPTALHKQMAIKMAYYEKQKNALQAQYDSARLYLHGVEQQIQQLVRQINSLNASIGYLQVAQNYSYMQTGFVDLNYQALMSGYMAQLTESQLQRTKLQGREASTITALNQMRLQAKVLEKSAPGQAFLVHQRIMLPGDLTHVPPPALLMVAGPKLKLKE